MCSNICNHRLLFNSFIVYCGKSTVISKFVSPTVQLPPPNIPSLTSYLWMVKNPVYNRRSAVPLFEMIYYNLQHKCNIATEVKEKIFSKLKCFLQIPKARNWTKGFYFIIVNIEVTVKCKYVKDSCLGGRKNLPILPHNHVFHKRIHIYFTISFSRYCVNLLSVYALNCHLSSSCVIPTIYTNF